MAVISLFVFCGLSGSRDTIIDTVNGLRTGQPRNCGQIPEGVKYLPLLQSVQDLLVWANKPPIQQEPWAVLRQWRETDHWPHLMPRLRMSGAIFPLLRIPPYRAQEQFYFMVHTSTLSITQDYMPTVYGRKVISNLSGSLVCTICCRRAGYKFESE